MLTVAAIDPKRWNRDGQGSHRAEEAVKVGNSRHIKIGDELVVTLRQAVIISLDKE